MHAPAVRREATRMLIAGSRTDRACGMPKPFGNPMHIAIYVELADRGGPTDDAFSRNLLADRPADWSDATLDSD
jgi:hypothetical protein